MSKFDEFGDRMKGYEAVETLHTFYAGAPVYARIDGRAFHTFTRGMHRPFDDRLTNSMVETTKILVERTHACIGYTQSDEISLCWEPAKTPFPKKHKMTSILASLTASAFVSKALAFFYPQRIDMQLPHFDCRVFNIPSKTEVANMFLWRAMDARKNAISMAAQSVFSHKQLQRVSQAVMLEMLQQEGIDFETAYQERHRHGVWIRRELVMKKITIEQWAAIPPEKRPSQDTLVPRHETRIVNIPIFNKVINREGVIFERQPALTDSGVVDA